MVSQVMLGKIDRRLKQATGRYDLFFGNKSVLLIGDPGQLQPVCGSVLYNHPPKSLLATHGLQCYQQFKYAIRLQVSQRQQNNDNDLNQEYFIQLLARLRDGMLDDEQTYHDWKFLLKNEITPSNLPEFQEAIRLFPDNHSCNQFNTDKLNEIKKPITKFVASNHPQRAKQLSDDNFSGLKNQLFFCKDSKITLTNNLWIKKGLVNGASGIIRDIIYYNKIANKELPYAVLIEFDIYDGPKFFSPDDHRHKWIPINSLNIFNNIVCMSRTQYPLRLAYALTIHKSQGQTLKKCIIDLGKGERSLGLAYVALSRVKSYKDFLIKAFPLDRLIKIKESVLLKPRINEEQRINRIINYTLDKFSFLIKK
jgi:ATP-dependent DNA helicase PIF1